MFVFLVFNPSGFINYNGLKLVLDRPKVRLLLFVMWCLAWPGIAVALLMPLPAGMILQSDKLTHFAVFGGMALGTAVFGRRLWQILGLCAFTALASAGLEFAQGLVPYRSFDLRDIAANVSGVLTGGAFACLAIWLLLRRPMPHPAEVST